MTDDAKLTPSEQCRYLRQMQVKEFGEAGQEKLRRSVFLVIGAGGLGCPASQLLAASGAGEIILADFDAVEESNLSRQFLHSKERVGMNKAESAAVALRETNPFVRVRPVTVRMTDETLRPLVREADVILDCCDNSATRHAVNRVCLAEKKPLVTAGCVRGSGQVCVFDFRRPDTPCYACAFPEDDEEDVKASMVGVLTPLTAVIGTLEASEAIKVAAGCGDTLAGKMLLADLLRSDYRVFALPKDPDCPVCGGR